MRILLWLFPLIITCNLGVPGPFLFSEHSEEDRNGAQNAPSCSSLSLFTELLSLSATVNIQYPTGHIYDDTSKFPHLNGAVITFFGHSASYIYIVLPCVSLD